MQIDAWVLYAVPLPLILLSPFTAGLTFVTRNFAREEHAFVWSDFWDAVKGNWKYFLLNGAIVYLVYLVLSFSMIYYLNSTSQGWLYYIPFWLCIVLAVLFLFAQYYLPVMFITFDLKFSQAYRNAFIFAVAGLGRNLLITVILGALLFLVFSIPLAPLTVLIFLIVAVCLLFSLVSYFINFTVYPIVDRYLIKPYQQKLEEQRTGITAAEKKEEEERDRFFAEPEDEDEDDDEDKFVYVNGRLIRKSELKKQGSSEEKE